MVRINVAGHPTSAGRGASSRRRRTCDDGPVTTDVVIQRIGGPEAEDPFVILAPRGVEPEAALSRYTERATPNGGASRRCLQH